MRLLADENFDGRILDGLLDQNPDLDILRVQDTEVYGASDPKLLAWAAENERILVSHDLKTMPKYAYARVSAGLPMPGVILISQSVPIATAIEEMLTVIGASDAGEYADKVTHLPL